MTVVACPLALIATACFAYTLRPGEYDGLGWLGSTALVFPLQFLALSLLGAGLAVVAWRFGALVPASAFALVAALTAATALWPSIALWQQARQDHVSLSLGAALIPRLNAGGPALEGSVVYATAADGTRLKLDVWRADSAATGAPHPAVVRVHGGAWIQGTRSDLSDWDRWLNRLGYDVFDIDYRMPPPARWRDEVGDVKCALGWVAAHADTYHVDPKRISVMGYSAGGNLALLAAYSMGDPRLPASCSTSTVTVRSAVNLYGPPDLSLIYRSAAAPTTSTTSSGATSAALRASTPVATAPCPHSATSAPAPRRRSPYSASATASSPPTRRTCSTAPSATQASHTKPSCCQARTTASTPTGAASAPNSPEPGSEPSSSATADRSASPSRGMPAAPSVISPARATTARSAHAPRAAA